MLTKDHRLSSLTDRQWFCHSSGGYKFEIKVAALPGQQPVSLACRTALCPRLHVVFSVHPPVSTVPPLIVQLDQGPPSWPHFTFITSVKALSPSTVSAETLWEGISYSTCGFGEEGSAFSSYQSSHVPEIRQLVCGESSIDIPEHNSPVPAVFLCRTSVIWTSTLSAWPRPYSSQLNVPTFQNNLLSLLFCVYELVSLLSHRHCIENNSHFCFWLRVRVLWLKARAVVCPEFKARANFRWWRLTHGHLWFLPLCASNPQNADRQYIWGRIVNGATPHLCMILLKQGILVHLLKMHSRTLNSGQM